MPFSYVSSNTEIGGPFRCFYGSDRAQATFAGFTYLQFTSISAWLYLLPLHPPLASCMLLFLFSISMAVTDLVPNQLTLLKLPAELRLLVYGAIFDEIVSESGRDVEECLFQGCWPKSRLRTYISLAMTCKQVRMETKPHFEKHYLQRLVVHFWNAPSLHSFAETVNILGGPYFDIRYSLRAQSSPGEERFMDVYNFQRSITILVINQINDLSLAWHELLSEDPRLADMEPGFYRSEEGFELDVYHTRFEKIAIVQFPYRPHRVFIKQTKRAIGVITGAESTITVMTGSMRSLNWSGYDSSIGQKALDRHVERRKRRTFTKRCISLMQLKARRRLSEPNKIYGRLGMAV